MTFHPWPGVTLIWELKGFPTWAVAGGVTGGALLAFVILVFAVTIVKLAEGQVGSLQGY